MQPSIAHRHRKMMNSAAMPGPVDYSIWLALAVTLSLYHLLSKSACLLPSSSIATLFLPDLLFSLSHSHQARAGTVSAGAVRRVEREGAYTLLLHPRPSTVLRDSRNPFNKARHGPSFRFHHLESCPPTPPARPTPTSPARLIYAIHLILAKDPLLPMKGVLLPKNCKR